MSVFQEYVDKIKTEYAVTEKQQGKFSTVLFTMADSDGLVTVAVSGNSTKSAEEITVRVIKAVESGDEYLVKCNRFNSQSTGIIAFIDKDKLVTSQTVSAPTVAKINNIIGQLAVVNSYVRK